MHAEIVARLRCPVCQNALSELPGALGCPAGHRFDLARQGYVSLLAGRVPASPDTADMVSARASVLAGGVFRPVADALAAAALDLAPPDGFVVDVGAGTGYYLAVVLGLLPGRLGLAVDVSTPAIRRAARAHPRADAVAADTWHGLPLADGCADLVLNVFAPRNGAEFHRVLRSTGGLLVVTPRPDHLAGLEPPVAVDPTKAERLEATLGPWFRLARSAGYAYEVTLTRAEAHQLVAMGPSARHEPPDALARRLASLPDPLTATISVTLSHYTPLSPPDPPVSARS
jgi:23S rRNA (guanine745-N1)-methyltransferase